MAPSVWAKETPKYEDSCHLILDVFHDERAAWPGVVRDRSNADFHDDVVVVVKGLCSGDLGGSRAFEAF